MRSIYFALKFFYDDVLNEKFNERLPLAKRDSKLPMVLSKEEINKMIGVTTNIKHRLVLMFLYHAGLRLNEVRNIRWNNINFDRNVIHIKLPKEKKRGSYFYIPN